MIDASASPIPAWKRYGTIVLVAALIVVVGFFVWNKELHHTSSAPPPPAPAAHSISTTSVPGHPKAVTATHGLPVSARDPFGA